jgi:hypothetical protein
MYNENTVSSFQIKLSYFFLDLHQEGYTKAAEINVENLPV